MWILPKLRTGDLVEVLSEEEILATLDREGMVEGMPFMPEMLQFCGRQFVVSSVAHKTCDTARKTGARKLDRTVHLRGVRCDGSAHGGCQADCNLFWREEWLRRIGAVAKPSRHIRDPEESERCTIERLAGATQSQNEGESVFKCQATELYSASRPLPWWNVLQYVLDVRTGNWRVRDVLEVLWLAAVRSLTRLPFGFRLFSSTYAAMHRAMTGQPPPQIAGQIPPGSQTPSATLSLRPGELVRVRALPEIAATLDGNSKNRGLWFDQEQVRYCNKRFAVRGRVTRIIDENTGRMLLMRQPCITLEDVVCRAQYSSRRLLCPRAIASYWRENWLERLDSAPGRVER